MAHILRLRLLKNQILCPIPREFVLALGLVKTQHVVVARADDGAITMRPLDDYLRERGRLRGNPA